MRLEDLSNTELQHDDCGIHRLLHLKHNEACREGARLIGLDGLASGSGSWSASGW